MRRREFIRLFSSTVVAWSLTARAQQPERMRRVGVLMGLAEADPFTIKYVQALRGIMW